MVATDPRKLRPAELCRLFNSTSLGEVISNRQLLRHRTRAGLRMGELLVNRAARSFRVHRSFSVWLGNPSYDRHT